MVFSKYKSCYTKTGNVARYYPQKQLRDKARRTNAKIYGNANMLHTYSKANIDNYKTYEYRLPINIIEYNTVEKRIHPTQKPVELLEYLIKTYTRENDIVLDNCMGSGSTRYSLY